MANTISTSTNALATSYTASQLVAISASGDALVVWFDGTNVKWSYAASSNYGSWTTATLLSSIGGGPRWQAGLYKLSNDNALLVVGNSSGNIVSYLFTYSSGGHSWSAGSAVTVEASASAFNGGSAAMDADAQGRIWVAWANNSHVIQVYYTSNNGTSWTSSTTFTQVGGGLDTNIGLAYCGNYIVVVYCASGAVMDYARIDAHSATLGSWSSSAAVTNCSFDNVLNAMSFRGAPGSNYGVFVGDEFAAIPAQYYNAGTDTWSTVSNIGASSSDRDPTLVSDGTNLYCVWCKQAASNNYSLVYKKWAASTQTWDSSNTQLEASGTNIQWPNGGYGNSTLGFIYGVGTASPWNVNFDTKGFGSTSNTKSVASRFRLAVQHIQSVGARFRQAINHTQSEQARFRLATTHVQSVAARFRLAVTRVQSIPVRFRLAVNRIQSQAARLRLATSRTQSQQSRLRLAIGHTQSLAARLRLANLRLQAIPARFLLATNQTRSQRMRLLLATSRVQSLQNRFRLASLHIQSEATRFRLSLAATRSTRARLLLAILHTQSISTRLRLASGRVQSQAARFVLGSTFSLKSVALRFRLAILHIQSQAIRLRVAIAHTQSLASRFLQATGHTQSEQARFRQAVARAQSEPLRFRQAIAHTQSQQARLRQALPHTQATAARLRRATSAQRSTQTRLRLATLRLLSAGTRFRKATGSNKAITGLFVLSHGSASGQTKYAGCRFVLMPNFPYVIGVGQSGYVVGTGQSGYTAGTEAASYIIGKGA